MSVNISPHQLQKSPKHHEQMQVNVNLSARQLTHPRLVDDVAQVLRETQLEPSRLVLEITEDVVMDAAESTLQILNALKALGVNLAIDDFGTGYSNLSYLKAFPLDVLKIDRRFVTGLQENSSDAMILHSMIDLAHALKLSVVAEGAETSEEVSQLRALNCDIVQGFYYARPMSAPDFEIFFQNHRPARAISDSQHPITA